MTEVQRMLGSIKTEAALLLNLSGGKDSTRMLGFVRERFPSVKTYAVMADTGFEHVEPVTAVDWCQEIAARFNLL